MLKKSKQLAFEITGMMKPKDSFGGSLLEGMRKSKRPLDSKLPIHLTLRARQSVLRLPLTFNKVQQIVVKAAKKYGVRIYQEANVGNHIHLVIKLTKIALWAAFIRELTGRIAQVLMGLGIIIKGRLWKFRPHTRIVRGWKKAFYIAKEYVQLNELEALGHISRKEIKTLKDLRLIFADG